MNWWRNYRTWKPFLPGELYTGSHSNAMEATGYKVFNDSVHGHITLHPLLVRVVDTPEFQRLRNIKQLGTANYVFPGASHSRYEHSLGTCYLAGQMVEKLLSRETEPRPAEEARRITLCVQLAALCHDLGHGPFSHSWESVTRLWQQDWKHEQASIDMFDYLLTKNELIEEFENNGLRETQRRMIKELIMGGAEAGQEPVLPPRDHFLYEIVSNRRTGIDVDKWDYFLRDGLHLNLRITFDYHRLLEFCTVVPGCDGYTQIAFRDKELMNLYDMYRVRSALHHTAYKHRVVLNIELMIVEAFKIAGNAGYKINNSDIPLREAHFQPEWLGELTDHVFYDLLYSRDPAVSQARRLLERVMLRQLFVFVGQANIALPDTLPVSQRQAHIKKKMDELESQLKNSCRYLEFRVAPFYLDLDYQNDPVSKVTFYKKVRGSNEIESVKFEEIKDMLHPFPFHLTRETTAQLLVFCCSKTVKSQDFEGAKRLIKAFSQ